MRKFSFLIFALILVGCSTGRQINMEDFQRIQIQTTTQAQVQDLIGKPENISTVSDQNGIHKIWRYNYTSVIAILFWTLTEVEWQTVTFNPQGIVMELEALDPPIPEPDIPAPRGNGPDW